MCHRLAKRPYSTTSSTGITHLTLPHRCLILLPLHRLSLRLINHRTHALTRLLRAQLLVRDLVKPRHLLAGLGVLDHDSLDKVELGKIDGLGDDL
jgi:hypothetical protein